MTLFLRLILWPSVIGTAVTILISKTIGSGKLDHTWFLRLLVFNMVICFVIGLVFTVNDRRRRR